MAESGQTVIAHPSPRARTRAPWRRGVDWIAFIFLLPAFIILTVFHIIPVAYALWISMQFGTVRNFRLACTDADTLVKIPETLGILRPVIACFDN